jgi:arabinofuranosyltransferase
VVLFAGRGARTTAGAVIGLSILTTSAAFVDYATSGLENPLTHLLLVGFYALFFRAARESDSRQLGLLAAIAGLAAVNRLDTLLLFLPALAYALGRVRPALAAKALLIGFLPLILWTAFSLFYYGFPFPNTAYAKLSSGLDRLALARQGLYYLGHTLRFDPPTAIGLAAGAAVPFVTRRPRHWMAAAGLALYLLYVVSIGGDFMRGRFLTGPLVVAVMLVADVAFRRQRVAAAVGLLAIAAATVLSPAPPLVGSREYGRRPGQLVIDRGIADERAYYYPALGLLNGRRDTHSWQTEGEQARAAGPAVIEKANAGLFGFYAGPQVHVLDPLALGDPLLARLPVADPADWRIGHFRRAIPAGYMETLSSGRSQIADPALAHYYDRLAMATRGWLSDPQRLATVWGLNVGRYDALLDAYLAGRTAAAP